MQNSMLKRIKEHYRKAEDLGNSVIGAFLFGYNNYNILSESEQADKSIKTIVVTVPTLQEILDHEDIPSQIIEDKGDIVEIVNIDTVFNQWLLGNPNYLEILFTDYRCVNPQYSSLIRELIEIREEIAGYDKASFCNQTLEIASSIKEKFQESPENKDAPKYLYYISHLYYVMKNFCEKERSFEQSLLEIPETLAYFYDGKDFDGSELSAGNISYKISHYFNVIKMAIDDLFSLSFSDLEKNDETYEKSFRIVSKVIEYGLTNILSGNSDEIQKLNSLVLQANKAAEEKDVRIRELSHRHQTELDMKDAKWKEELDALNSSYQEKLQEKEDSMEFSRRTWTEKIVALRQENKDALKEMKDSMDNEVRSRKEELEAEFKQEKERWLKQLKEKDTEIEEIKERHQSEFSKLKENYEFKFRNAEEINKQIVASLNEEHGKAIQAKNDEIEAVKAACDEKLERQRNSISEECREKDTEISQLRKQSDEKDLLIGRLRRDIEDYKELLSSLEESAGETHEEIVEEQEPVLDEPQEPTSEQTIPEKPKKKHWWNFY